MNEQNTYYAFISYNSADEKWAKWLQHNLEYYHIPSAWYKEYPELPKKIRPVFGYKKDLSGTKLKKALNNELSSSKYLIVICSQDSAKAEWVNDEVVAFIEQGKGDRIIPFIVAGTPHANNPDDCRSIDEILNNKELREKLTFDDREIIAEAHHNAQQRTLWKHITKTNHRDATYYKGLLEECTRELLFYMKHDFMEEV